MLSIRYITLAAVALAAVALVPRPATAADSAAEEQRLIGILDSSAAPAEKAIACKMLAIHGNKAAVPSLARLLPDKDLSSWARIALEAIPDPAADAALRDALNQTQGRLLIGIINSIGYRRDAQAVDGLVGKLTDSDVGVASSAAAALGKIGGDQAAAALERFLPASSVPVRPAAAEGCIVAAERFLADGQRDKAIKLYDLVRATEVPKQRLLEAIRGAILARGNDGIPLLLEQLRSEEKATLGIGLRVARELPGAQVTDALIAELAKADPQRKGLLIYALADRGDARALPAIVQSASGGPTAVRIVAVSVLEQVGNASCVPALLAAAADNDAELSKTAKAVLARLHGKTIDDELFARLGQSSGKVRQVLIELAEQRRIEAALPLFVQYAQDPDAGVRSAALVAVGSSGQAAHAADLVSLLTKTRESKDRGEIEKALTALCSRWGAACVQHVLPLARSQNSADRIVAANALACCGGAESLAAVRSLLNDNDEAVRDQTVRTLSTWPNRWPDDATVAEPLLELARSGAKPQYRVLALRGYLQFVQGARRLGNDQKLAALEPVMPLMTRPEEKRLAISALSGIRAAGAVRSLVSFAGDPAIADEACSAIVNLIGRGVQGLSRQDRQTALQTVLDKTKINSTREKAQELLRTTR